VPLYEYTCQACSHAFETLVFDDDEVECPQCRSSRPQRQFSVPARPHVESEALSMSCNPNLPPCGPGCCRLPPE
jgi:putative FmdB family regulatory protein